MRAKLFKFSLPVLLKNALSHHRLSPKYLLISRYYVIIHKADYAFISELSKKIQMVYDHVPTTDDDNNLEIFKTSNNHSMSLALTPKRLLPQNSPTPTLDKYRKPM
ncbi:hypothetical protein GEMRC1_007949 [Eukaryota sp. GEM-RC1]